ncbi:MAG: TMEM175 family protein [Bacteroidetes bacterium]|nr:TMEM175 family protein [Bacteroidota bacterium]
MINHEEHHRKKLDRANTFVDAVLAIVITLLVLDLRVPVLKEANSTAELMEKLTHLLPHLYAFLLCFVIVLNFWNSNHIFFAMVVKYYDGMTLNLGLQLITFCLLPFAASLIGEYPNNTGAFLIFGGLYLYGSIMAYLSMKSFWRNKVFSSNVDLKLIEEKIMKYLWLSPVMALLLMCSAFINTTLTLVLFAAIEVLQFVMTRQLKLMKEEEE